MRGRRISQKYRHCRKTSRPSPVASIMLGASRTRNMIPVQLDLDTISTNISKSAQPQHNMEQRPHTSLIPHQDKLTDCVTHRDKRISQRIADVKEVLKVQAVQVQASQLNQPGHVWGYRSSYPKAFPRTRKHTQHLSSESPEGVGMQVTSTCRMSARMAL